MSFVIEKKLKNVMTFYYLMKLDKKIPTDREFIRKRQGKKVHELMKCAYEVPFYRERFERCHLTPDDFHSAEDLAKFPVPVDHQEHRLSSFRPRENLPVWTLTGSVC